MIRKIVRAYVIFMTAIFFLGAVTLFQLGVYDKLGWIGVILLNSFILTALGVIYLDATAEDHSGGSSFLQE